MDDYYMGEIRMFAGLRAPSGWHFCDGTLLKISDYAALFALLGTTYGGNGRTTFALPDLRGRLPIGQGQGTNLAAYPLGKSGGSESVKLTINEMPAHSHTINVTAAAGTTNIPENDVGWANGGTIKTYAAVSAASPVDATMHTDAFSYVGNNLSHNNMMPSLAINFIISLTGTYPKFA